jgi:AcrR family transcriptional regulator
VFAAVLRSPARALQSRSATRTWHTVEMSRDPGPLRAGRNLRADAQRNRQRILLVAEEEFLRDGATASLEQIARRAGVGSATLHRHFSSRNELLSAVFHERVDGLCATAQTLSEAPDAGSALVEWLYSFASYAASTRGLAEFLLAEATEASVSAADAASCVARLEQAVEGLLLRAEQQDRIRKQVSAGDLLTIISAVALAGANVNDSGRTASRLVELAINGIRP